VDSLIEASDGKFYGTTENNVLFSLTKQASIRKSSATEAFPGCVRAR
jgi:hypothetical protein